MKPLRLVLLFFTLIPNIYGSTWGILPVKFENYRPGLLSGGPSLDPDNPLHGWEMAKLFKLYLNSNYNHNIIPIEAIQNAYRKNKVGLNSDLDKYQLEKISSDTDADKLLMTRVIFSSRKITVNLQTYYTQSGEAGESVSFSGDNLYYLLAEALKSQFQVREDVLSRTEERLNYIFAMDASGRNYNEIRAIPELVREFDIQSFSGVSVDGYGKSLILNQTADKKTIYQYLEKIKPQSTDPEGKIYLRILDEIAGLKNSGKSRVICLFVSGAPSSIEYRQKTNGLIRKLSRHNKIVIFGGGKMSPADRNYWHSLSTVHKNIRYSDILYSVRAGLSSGDSVYLIKNGDRLLESNINEVENSHPIELSIDQKEKFQPENIVRVFEEAAYRQTVDHGNISIKFNLNPLQDIFSQKSGGSSRSQMKILVAIGEKPFWIKIPTESAESGYGSMKIEENENYYFLLNLEEGGQGIPFRNSPGFGRILPASEVPRLLILDIGNYLKDPSNYLHKSIGSSSLYIIYGTVKEVQIEKKILY